MLTRPCYHCLLRSQAAIVLKTSRTITNDPVEFSATFRFHEITQTFLYMYMCTYTYVRNENWV